ncbi:MAG: hypothetical protein M1834_001916 [Cirrosporium novae-zelandiae]|nr:MAG: hypothetical protein M1834_001916 [Cirrosporium novae-zelandiae]
MAHDLNGSSSGGGNLTRQQALAIVRDSDSGQVDISITRFLEGEIDDIWRRIQAQPNTYVMSEDEFAVFNYFRARFRRGADDSIAASAVKRFWDHYKLTHPTIDGHFDPDHSS